MRSTVGHISINKMGTSRFSSDLDMGRRPKLKSDENKEVPILYIEILKCEHFFTVKKVLHLIGASVRGRHRCTSRGSAQARDGAHGCARGGAGASLPGGGGSCRPARGGPPRRVRPGYIAQSGGAASVGARAEQAVATTGQRDASSTGRKRWPVAEACDERGSSRARYIL